MNHRATILVAMFTLTAGGGCHPTGASAPPTGSSGEGAGSPTQTNGSPTEEGASASAEAAGSSEEGSQGGPEFKENRTGTPGLSQGVKPSAIKPTDTEAALKFTVVDKDKGPIPGIVIKLTDPKGGTYYTEETDAKGYAEMLVPIGRKYEVVYLSLGRQEIATHVSLDDGARQTLRLTLRYKRHDARKTKGRETFVLKGVQFDTAKATIRPESHARLDSIVEYMKHKTSVRIQISGHTDNVGKPKSNKALSKRRAQACREYLISKGIDGSRIEAVGYGDERPIASNDTDEGRQENRRIEAIEL